MPPLDLDLRLKYLQKMTDAIGMVEHAKYHFPRKTEGYTTDDNARAYQVMLRLHRPGGVYFQFLQTAVADSALHNDMGIDGKWTDSPGYGEWFGRTVAAFAEGSATATPTEKPLCQQALDMLLKNKLIIESLRTKAQIICAIGYLPHPEVAQKFADDLVKAYDQNQTGDWQWFDKELTYDTGRLPMALFKAYQFTHSENYLHIATETLNFLLASYYHPEADCFTFPGTYSWWKKTKPWELFAQQPVEAGSLVEACVSGYLATQNPHYKQAALLAWNWYSGKNLIQENLLDNSSGGVRDSITESGCNLNQGAEAVLSYLLAGLALKELQ